MLKNFDIFSPVLGLKEDQPGITLPAAFMTDNRNVLLRNGVVSRVSKPAGELNNASGEVQTTDTFPVIKYHYFEKSDGNNYLLAFTKAHIYHWNTSTHAWVDVSLAAGLTATATHWSVCTFNNTVIATNGLDKVLEWSGTGAFTVLDHASGLEIITSTTYLTTARYVVNFENHLILGGVTVGGTFYASDIYWCSIGDKDDWSSTGSGSATIEGPDSISGFGLFGNFLIIFKERSIQRMWLTSDPTLIFNAATMSRTVGTGSPDSIVPGESGELYFFANDFTVRAIVGLTSEFPIVSKSIVKTLETVPNTYLYDIRAKYTKRYRQLIFSLVTGTDATANNTVLIYAEGAWTRHDMTVTAFGEYERSNDTYTIDTIPTYYPTIDSIEWETIDGVDRVNGYRTDLISDASGYTYTMFGSETVDGSDYEGYFSIGTDFSLDKRRHNAGQINDLYKRLLMLRVYFGSGRKGDVTLSIQKDFSGNWDEAGTVDLTEKSGNIDYWDVPVDFRAKHFQLKVACSDPFTFIGATFKYNILGER